MMDHMTGEAFDKQKWLPIISDYFESNPAIPPIGYFFASRVFNRTDRAFLRYQFGKIGSPQTTWISVYFDIDGSLGIMTKPYYEASISSRTNSTPRFYYTETKKMFNHLRRYLERQERKGTPQ